MDGSGPLDPLPGTIALARPEATAPDRDAWAAVRRGVLGLCPRCGEGRLFGRYLKVVPACPRCGQDLSGHRADDGPAYLTILLVGHLVGFAMHFTWTTFRPEPLVFALGTSAGAVALSLWLLPRVKGAIIGFQWARHMHGFGAGEAATD